MTELPVTSLDRIPPQEVQKLSLDKRRIGNCDVTFVGVEHDAPKRHILYRQ